MSSATRKETAPRREPPNGISPSTSVPNRIAPKGSSAKVSRGVLAKAQRLAGSGRINVVVADSERVIAAVEGDHGRYVVTWDTVAGWECGCPAWARLCAHVTAVHLVCQRP